MKQAVIKLDDFDVTIKEVRLKDIFKVISNLKEVFSDENLDIHKLISEKYDTVASIAEEFIVVSGDYELDDLTCSDIDMIIPAFKEVNASFLDKILSMGLTAEAFLPPAES